MAGLEEGGSVPMIDIEDDNIEWDDYGSVMFYRGRPFTGMCGGVDEGARYECPYVNGLPKGLHKFWYPSGVLKETCMYGSGIQNGNREKFYETGELMARYQNVGDKICRLERFSPTGEVIETIEVDLTSQDVDYIQSYHEKYEDGLEGLFESW